MALIVSAPAYTLTGMIQTWLQRIGKAANPFTPFISKTSQPAPR
jgi:hypothetical protein